MIRLISAFSKAVMPRALPLIWLDAWLAARGGAGPAPAPVFIVGPPRSGTTILYQSLLNAFRFTWTSNVDSALFAMPYASHQASWVFKARGVEHGEASEFGYIPGLWSASEAGPMLRLFLENPKRQAHFAKAVRAHSTATGLPYIVKNTPNSLRLPAILNLFPDAVIIWSRREREANARSILKLRRHEGDEAQWASVRPEGAGSMSHLPPLDQARWQVDEIHHVIARDLAAAGRQAVIVEHEAFIKDRANGLDAIAKAYENQTGQPLVRQAGINGA